MQYLTITVPGSRTIDIKCKQGSASPVLVRLKTKIVQGVHCAHRYLYLPFQFSSYLEESTMMKILYKIVKNRLIYHMSAERAHRYKVPKRMPDREKRQSLYECTCLVDSHQHCKKLFRKRRTVKPINTCVEGCEFRPTKNFKKHFNGS